VGCVESGDVGVEVVVMADIKWAAQQMSEGKKVRRHEWVRGDFIKSSECPDHARVLIAVNEKKQKIVFHIDSLLADDWEIAE
jgi:hypothetical protein